SFLFYNSTAKEAYLEGFFFTISVISNTALGLSNDALADFSSDNFILNIIIYLIIIGSIACLVLIEIKRYLFKNKNQKKKFRFTLFTKVTTTTFFFLVALGTIMIYLIDRQGFMQGKSWHEGIFYALFQSVTTRSAGLT